MRNTTYAWRQAVQEAIAETDADQLQRKIELAEVAIFERIDTFLATALSFDHHIIVEATIRFIRASIDLQQTTVRMQLRSFHLLAPAFPAT
jgi:hypothetical protein